MTKMALVRGPIASNEREEYGAHYRRLAAAARPAGPIQDIAPVCQAPLSAGRSEVLLLGAAGQYVNTAGEVLCLAGMSGGLHVTQKNDYPITVLRGHSVSEVVLDRKPVGYTGISKPSVILCVASEGIDRRKSIFQTLENDTLIIKGRELRLPDTKAKVVDVDFARLKIKPAQRALATLAVLAGEGSLLNKEMLLAGVTHRYHGKMLEEAMSIATRLSSGA